MRSCDYTKQQENSLLVRNNIKYMYVFQTCGEEIYITRACVPPKESTAQTLLSTVHYCRITQPNHNSWKNTL